MFKSQLICRLLGYQALGILWLLGLGMDMLRVDAQAMPGAAPSQAAVPRQAQAARHDTAQVNWLNKQAFVLHYNHAEQTRQLAQQALQLAQQLHYDRGQLNAHFSLGYYYRGANKYDSALYHTQQALRLAAKMHSNYDRTRGLYNLARIYFGQGNYSRALAINQQGLAVAQAVHNRRMELYHFIQAGLIEIELGEYASAQTHFDQALRLAQSLKDNNGIGGAYNGLGDLNRQQARWNLAGHYYTAAATSYRDVLNTHGMMPIELSVAEMTERQGNHAAALLAARRLLRQTAQAYWEGLAARAKLLLGRIYLATGQSDSARYYAERSLSINRRHGIRPEIRDAALVLAQANAQLGKWNQAYQYQTLAINYADSLTGEDTRHRVAALQEQEAQRRQQIQLQLVQQQARLQTQQQELMRLRYHQQLAALLVLALVFAAGGSIFLWRYRRREARRQEALRTRIAADLHDEVGSMLTQISMQSTLLREGRYAPAQQQLYLDQMAEASRRAARQMRDAVWSIDARYDSAASLLDRLRDHAHEVLPPAGLELDFGVEAGIITATVPLATRQALYSIYKEALHNVVKHAHAQQVYVRLRLRQQQLELEVRDDGCGLAGAGRPGGQGLPNMRMRAQAVGGTIGLAAAQPGTCLVVRLPLR